jgi:hypothetical protein
MARKANFALIGTGGVGRALLESILSSREHHAATYGVWFNACLVADSTGAVALPSIGDAKLRLALAAKASGGKLSGLEGVDGVRARPEGTSAADFLCGLVAELEPESIVIDCTATEDTIPALQVRPGRTRRAKTRAHACARARTHAVHAHCLRMPCTHVSLSLCVPCDDVTNKSLDDRYAAGSAPEKSFRVGRPREHTLRLWIH